jgi:hypothetical protein
MLTEAQKQFFSDEGYLAIPGVVPPAMCDRVIDVIVEFLDLDLNDPATWYASDQSSHGDGIGHGIVPVHHAQPLWDIRQHPRVYEAFCDLYEHQALWVSLDRVSYKPPRGPQTSSWQRHRLHWDCDPWTHKDLSIQGVLYLTDTAANQGPFCCVPGIYRDLPAYLGEHANEPQRLNPGPPESDVIGVGGAAGTLVVFNRLMPHSSLVNQSGDHRFVQYLTMQPAGDETERAERVQQWQNRMPPAWALRQKIADQQIPEAGAPATLTELGRRLVGVANW